MNCLNQKFLTLPCFLSILASKLRLLKKLLFVFVLLNFSAFAQWQVQVLPLGSNEDLSGITPFRADLYPVRADL